MKKKQKTFAERAKEVQAKYTRADFDALERKDMMKELAALRDEQEAVRSSMGVGNNQPQKFAFGGGYEGFKTFKTGQPTMNIPADNPYGNSVALNNSMATATSTGIPRDNSLDGVQAPVDVNNSMWEPMMNSGLYNNSPRSMSQAPQQYQSMTDSLWPTAISAASSIIGDIAGMRNMKKNIPQSVTLPRMAPVSINLQPQREALQRSYNTASNVMSRNARDVSNPANAYANQIAGLSALTDSLGTQMGQSYMNEANTNAQLSTTVGSKNADLATQEALQNLQLKTNRAGANANYINSLSQTIPLALKDYREQVNQTNLINTMGKYYGLYSKITPNMNSWQKFAAGLKGNQYSVLNKNNPNIIS